MSLPGAAPPGGTGSALLGEQRPRLFTCPPWVTSAGADVAELAAVAGLNLDDWQAWYLTQALGEREPDGKWAAFACALICSRQNGKDVILEARQLAGMYLFGETLIIHTAHEFKTAQESYLRILALVEGTPEFDAKVARTPASHGEEGIELLPTPAIITGSTARQISHSRTTRLRFVARSKHAARGFSGDLVIYNEAMTLDPEGVAASLPTMMARWDNTDGGPQVWYTASAGKGRESLQLARVRSRALASIAAGRPLSRQCFAEWSIDPHDETCPAGCTAHDDLDDPRAHARANPGYNLPGRISAEMIENARGEMDEATFAREICGVGVYPAPEAGWQVIPQDWWAGTMAADDTRPAGPAGAIDTTPDRSWTSIGVCGAGPAGRPRLELADHRGGVRWAAAAAAQIDRARGGMTWVIDKRGAAAALIKDLTDAGLRVETPTAAEVAQACGRLFDAFREGELDHAADREVRAGIAGLAQRRAGDWDRDASAVDISGVYAYTLALWGWERFAAGPEPEIGETVDFGERQIMHLFTSGTYGPGDLARMRSRGLITDAMLTRLAAAGVPVPSTIS